MQNFVTVSHTVCMVKKFLARSSQDWGRGLPLETRSSSISVNVPNFVAIGQTVWPQWGSKKIGWRWAPSIGQECPKNGCLALRNSPIPDKCSGGKLCRYRSNGWCAITEISQTTFDPWPFPYHLSRSRKVTETDRDRSDTHDFLLVVYSIYGHISCRFRDKGDICKIYAEEW